MSDRSAVAELLADLSDALGARRWYVFGAQAVTVLGLPRMTADVDVTVEAGEGGSTGLAQALASAGFELRVPDPEEFVRAARVLPFVHVRTGIPLDVVLAGSGLEVLFLDRAVPRDMGGVEVPVISAGDLVVAKVLAGRAKDLEDAVGVLREQRAKIDLSAIRAVVSEIEHALDQSDLTPLLEEVVRRASRGASPKSTTSDD